LELDCGPGYTVDADWYFPDTEEPPTRLIYFQHGFPGSSVEYDYTAAELAERNNAIVVVPTISSNLFDCYACNLGGDPMHAAVGKLFIGEREELLASAKAAGFEGEALPERFVLMGHSGGGQLVGGAAGYFEEFAPDAEDYNLAGVILLDTSPIGGVIERGVAKIAEDIPVYTISAAPNFLNSKGAMNKALVAARPGQFVGVELVNGAHGDGFQSHNPIVQLGGQLFSMAFSRPENVEAVHVLSQGWINDWYEGTHTGVYGELGSTIDIPGTDGARAYVLPTPAPQLTFIDLIVNAAFSSTLLFQNFASCAEDPSATASSAKCSAESVEEAV
jgi:pimeloyl-ACP methyl ester carboxylesterase